MFSIAVVDDEQAHRDILVKYIEEWKKQKAVEAEVETFHSSDAFYFTWCEDQRFDVLFLDICMKGTDGVSLAKKLREKGKTVNIIFTTGVADYMQEGFEVEALHYLLKPVKREKVWECLEKCFTRKAQDSRFILLPTEDGLIKTDADGILYAEAVGHSCELVCLRETLSLKLGIREAAQRLEEYGDFMFCHRSYLVNLHRISKMGKQDIIMDNGRAVPVSRRMYGAVNEGFMKLFRVGSGAVL